MRASSLLLAMLCSGCCHSAELQVIDDFELGVGSWYRVEGSKPAGAGPLCVMTPGAEAKVGQGAARLQFSPCPDTWTHMQMGIRTVDWLSNHCDRIGFWLKGDGSGETLTLMFGNYEHRPGLCYRYRVKLDFSQWRHFEVPFENFEPRGEMGANVGNLVLAQLNVGGTERPVDVLLDELVALPAHREGRAGRLFDLSLLPAGGWDHAGPEGPVTVDNLLGLPEGTVLPGTIHGIRNHADLHNPPTFVCRYPDPGGFGVKIGRTSGYGGSRLIIKVDGEEALRRDFPGETETALTQYQGYYSVEVPAGEHTITVDNDGNDWITVEAYCFENYRTAGARYRREDGRMEVRLLGADGRPVTDAEASIDVVGTLMECAPEADGALCSEVLWGRFAPGTYPVTVVARRGGEPVFTTELRVRLGRPRLRTARAAYPVTEDVTVLLRYANEAGAPLSGRSVKLLVDERAVDCSEVEPGTYSAHLGRLPAGRYFAFATADDGPTADVPFLVYDAQARPWETEGPARLGDNGWLKTADGKAYVPWGYATISLYAPDAEVAAGLAGPSLWSQASDEDILNWIGMLAACGVNCVRFGVNVGTRSICGDLGGRANPEVIAALHRFLDLIAPLGVRAIPVMWWGHYRNFGYDNIAAYDALIQTQADWFTNPEALRLQKQYVAEVVAQFRDDPRILAWEVMNETYRAGEDLLAAVRWTNEIAAVIRQQSPRHLITTSACEATPGPELEWNRKADIDFFNYHAYPMYPDYRSYRTLAGDSPREMGNYAAVMTLYNRLGPKVSILGEAGNDRAREANYPELRALITRDCLWLSFLNGSPGGISWDAIADAREFSVLSRIAQRVDWTRFGPAPAAAVVEVSDPDAQLPQLARYTWWSLERCIPLRFVSPGTPLGPEQLPLPPDRFAPPEDEPATALRVSAGFQGAYLQSEDGKVFIAYVRRVGAVPRINTRVRSPEALSIRVTPPSRGTLEVWDLDLKRVVKEMPVEGPVAIDLGRTAHDYALALRP